MLLTDEKRYDLHSYDYERELEVNIFKLRNHIFGDRRIYLEFKKLIGAKGKTNNIPDAYLLDLSSHKDPSLFVVENELARHDPIKHISIQLLEFSLSFDSAPNKLKRILKEQISMSEEADKKIQAYLPNSNYDNLDHLLDHLIYKPKAFNALVIIDEVSDELETALLSRFKFPVELIELKTFKANDGSFAFEFEPFMQDVFTQSPDQSSLEIDPDDLDTIVVPANKEGFDDVFLGENCWYSIRIGSKMTEQLKYIAAYQTKPISAITHIAEIAAIEQFEDTNKYLVRFSGPAKAITNIPLGSSKKGSAPQAPRYTTYKKLTEAKTLSEVFY